MTFTVNHRGNWTDGPCYYVSVMHGPRRAILAGPFAHQRQAAAAVDSVRRIGEDIDAKAVFYLFGTCKTTHGHREGSLNKHVDWDKTPHKPRQHVARPDRYGYHYASRAS